MTTQKQENVLKAMELANPDKPGDLIKKLREIDPETALEIEILTLMSNKMLIAK